MEWSIQQIARAAGTTSRALRHYGDEGLLPATRIGSNGYRYYDESALVRLQRILLLRELGLSLPRIRDVLENEADEKRALKAHLGWLEQERDRIGRQIAAVETTIQAREKGEELMADKMFDGFDHTQYRDEVESRWGADAYAAGDRWWRGMSAEDKAAWQERIARLGRDWASAAEAGIDSSSAEAQALARRHVEWLTGVPGTPAAHGGDVKGYVIGLGDMYVADDRFAANYGGTAGATFVRDALRIYAEANL
ncbi:MerR family transcriptional regulator [Microbacterium halotolerans]|uniref:MerR family transcriptional regulator n=1 Tax=Microbacterium halotolerans TaxID=246613 RepID=UPI000E6AE24C|nr:MerR family transcriptional regulator [Microbacterium halotolerans]